MKNMIDYYEILNSEEKKEQKKKNLSKMLLKSANVSPSNNAGKG
jgi:hypothetical protein